MQRQLVNEYAQYKKTQENRKQFDTIFKGSPKNYKSFVKDSLFKV